jgi:hypothetical protein
LGFHSPQIHWLPPSQCDLFFSPLGRISWFYEKEMFLSWFALVSLWMRIGKWPPKHAIFIDCLHQVNTTQDLKSFCLTTISCHSFSTLIDIMKLCLSKESTKARSSCHWRHSWRRGCSHGVSV